MWLSIGVDCYRARPGRVIDDRSRLKSSPISWALNSHCNLWPFRQPPPPPVYRAFAQAGNHTASRKTSNRIEFSPQARNWKFSVSCRIQRDIIYIRLTSCRTIGPKFERYSQTKCSYNKRRRRRIRERLRIRDTAKMDVNGDESDADFARRHSLGDRCRGNAFADDKSVPASWPDWLMETGLV